MSDVLRDRRVAILATDGVERVELLFCATVVEAFAEGHHHSERHPVGHLPH